MLYQLPAFCHSAALLFAFSGSCLAQNVHFKTQHYSVEHGLSDRVVNCVYQDSRGFLWFSTRTGLNMFDGEQFKTWSEQQGALFTNQISEMAEDSQHRLWLFHTDENHNANIHLFDPFTSKSDSLSSLFPEFNAQVLDNLVMRFVQDQYGNIVFFSQSPAQMHMYDVDKNKFRHTPIAGYKRLFPLAVSNRNTIWAKSGVGEMIEIDFTGKILQKITVDEEMEFQDEVTERGFYTYQHGQCIHYNFEGRPDTLPTNKWHQPASRLDSLHFLSLRALQTLNERYDALITPPDEVLASLREKVSIGTRDKVNDWLADRLGNIWLATDFGVKKISAGVQLFQNYLHSNAAKTLEEQVACRGLLQTGNMLLVNDEFFGLRILDENTGDVIKSIQSEEQRSNYALTLLRNGHIAYSTPSAIEIMSADLQSLQSIPLPEIAWHIHETENQKLLLGTGYGLAWCSLHDGSVYPFDQYGSSNTLSAASIIHIMQGADGRRWICSSNGLFEMDTSFNITGRYHSQATGKYKLPCDNFYHIMQDADGVMWISTAACGLIRWEEKTGQHRVYNKDNGLPNNTIYACYEDDYGQLWLSSDFGIVQMDKATGTIRSYQQGDGIADLEFNRTSHFKSVNGKIYFGSLNGVTALNPEAFHVRSVRATPQLQVVQVTRHSYSGFMLDDLTQQVLASNTIYIGADDELIHINMAMLGYGDNDKPEFVWRLDSTGNVWNSQKHNSITIGKLPYGLHKLFVKARTEQGQWSIQPLIIDIYVSMPFYHTQWFKVLCVLMVVVCFVLCVKWGQRIAAKRIHHQLIDRH
ncbi:MAG: two-component regulator propeller domain-containing protein [Flavobacteriales bacterium]